ncbi:SdrD B-like domain-containing protein [Marinicrinis sediminis]|uniref:SdrD B-like domain-containing protein n=1 Tax=Marinicrinis sediminis TaxID=1652465 RepID=A0ABW5R6A5_9BACL
MSTQRGAYHSRPSVPFVLLGSLGNYVWEDENEDGRQNEPEEKGVNDISVELYKEHFSGTYVKIAHTMTGEKEGQAGYYLFDNLQPGKYQVCFIAPEGYEITAAWQGGDVTIDSDANMAEELASGHAGKGCSGIIVLGTGEHNLTIDAGMVVSQSVEPTEPDTPTNPEEPEAPANPEEPETSGKPTAPEHPDDMTVPPHPDGGDENVVAGHTGEQSAGDTAIQAGGDAQDELPEAGESAPVTPWIGALLCALGIFIWRMRSSQPSAQ